ncbi:formate/nitrite transporter FocA (FNT family) [Paraburkholderia sp. BL27I4N3]|uniref:formate/nitrite transporter family protein n=1 Tax=Paraburkholderia sp. BL27I4N3 TaxID=1938805 RepID=UPI000E2523E5|nr:formate/nitrite transporter family protein [Paraburkholderia sp. BL27I4N3]REE21749.1 formate/nitrite transporter FocA (FNT family) [Paraburkholderia sp. BL27I4N3]
MPPDQTELRGADGRHVAAESSSVHDAQEAGADSPHLDEGQQDQAADHASPHALVLHEIVREEGEAALARTIGALAWSSLAAGLSMGFSFLVPAVLEAQLPEAHWRSLVSSFGYTVGFVLVIMGRQQLFTESTLTVVLPVLTRRDASTVRKALRLWAVVLLCNLIGTWIFAAMLRIPGVFSADVIDSLRRISVDAMASSTPMPTVVRALLAGWLIALMVWLLPSARSGRLLTVLLITYVVGVTHLSHIIAGSTEIAYAWLAGIASPADYFGKFLLPTLAGNVIGGTSLVALLNHAAIAPEMS